MLRFRAFALVLSAAAGFAGLAGPDPARAAGRSAAPFVVNVRPELVAPRTDGAIHIDGRVDEPAWRHAALATGFAEIDPGDNVRPPVRTEVRVTWDDDHLYVAFVAHDDDPSSIRASMRARDQIWKDDYVGVFIDPWGNAAWAYEIYANPYGIQGDRRYTPQGDDEGFDVVYESRGRVTDDGYEVEMAIPFRSLRFPARERQLWRVNFMRVHPRDSRRRYSWAAISRDDPCFPCQWGTLTGMRDVHAGSSVDVLPALTGSRSGRLRNPSDPTSGFVNTDPDGQVSLGARYAFSPSTSAEVTVNPDFSQVESDFAQVDINTTFALFFPERRPFFQEGSDLYRSFFNMIYTRQINDPSVAAKLTARGDRTSVFYLFGRDEESPLIIPLEDRSLFAAPGRSVSNIARVRRSFGEDDFVGALVTDRRYDGGGSNTAGGVDLSWRFTQNWRVEGQALVARTREPDTPGLTSGQHDPAETFDHGRHTVALDGEAFTGAAYYAALERDARHWNTEFSLRETQPTFRADNGFVTRASDRRLAWENSWVARPDNALLDRIVPAVTVWQRWNSRSVRKGRAIENLVTFVFKKQTRVLLGYDRTEERFRGVYFRGIDLYYVEFNTDAFDAVRFGFWLGLGDRIARTAQPAPFLGTGGLLDLWGTVRLGDRLGIEPWFTWSRLRNPDTDETFFSGFITRTKINYQFTRELFLRLVLQYDDFTGELNLEPLLTWQLNPFSVFYVGAGVDYLDYDHESLAPSLRTGDGFEPFAWQGFFKFQYFYRF